MSTGSGTRRWRSAASTGTSSMPCGSRCFSPSTSRRVWVRRMAKTIMTGYGVEHPAPLAGAVPGWLLFTVLPAPPTAWLVQLYVDYGLPSQACFPRDKPLSNGLAVSPAVWTGSLALVIGTLGVGRGGAPSPLLVLG